MENTPKVANLTDSELHHVTRRHVTYISKSFRANCFLPADFLYSTDEECEYVKNTHACHDLVEILNYLQFMICNLHVDRTLLGAIKIVAFLSSLLICYVCCMVVVMKYFIVPNILTMSRNIKISGYKIGFTLTASVLTLFFFIRRLNLSECKQVLPEETATLALCQEHAHVLCPMMISFILLSFRGNFSISPRLLYTNMMIVACAQLYLLLVAEYEERKDDVSRAKNYVIRMRFHCGVLLLVFLLYCLIHMVTWYLSYRTHKETMRAEPPKTELQPTSKFSIDYARKTIVDLWFGTEGQTEVPVESPPPLTNWALLHYALNAFESASQWTTTFKILFYPFWVILAIFVPVYEPTRPLNGWCKYLLFFQLTALTIFLYLMTPALITWCCLITPIIGLIIYILFYTKSTEAPTYYYYFTFMGVFIGFMFFNAINTEAKNAMYQTFSYMHDWNRDAMILLGEPFGLSLGVGILNWSFIQAGNPSMAYGVTWALVLYATCVMVPITVFDPCFTSDTLISNTDNLDTSFDFIMVAVLSITISVTMTNYRLRRSHSFFFSSILLLYVMYIWLGNNERIHPYGSQHSVAFEPEYPNANWA